MLLLLVMISALAISSVSASEDLMQDNSSSDEVISNSIEEITTEENECDVIESDNGNDIASDSGDYRSIQEQIDSASEGDNVTLSGSTYSCDYLVVINKTITLDGTPESYSGKFVRYTNESGEYVYDSRTRKSYNLSSQCPSLKRLTNASRRFKDDRYYFVTDDVYKRTFIFDMNSDGKMIGDINGRFGDNNQLLYHNLTFNYSNYFFVERNDSVQLFRLSDNFIAEGICLPWVYVKAARWKNGFITIEDNGSATNRTLIYSMIDECPPTEFYRSLSGSMLNGNTLIVTNDHDIVVYHYDNLCDLIKKTSHLDKQTKQKLITRCRFFK